MNPEDDRDWERQLAELPLGTGGFSVKTMKKVKERIAMRHRKPKRWVAVSAAALALAAALTVWSVRGGAGEWLNGRLSPEPSPSAADAAQEIRLKVQYWDSESFMQNIGRPFLIRNPSYRFETAYLQSWRSVGDYIRWVRQERPDVLQIPLAYVDDLARAGLLLPLDDRIARDGYDLGGLYEPVVRILREAGAGKLYGLAPHFNTYALFYNRTLFEQNGVPLPQDGMTWDDVLRTAARFGGRSADGKPVYGLSFGGAYYGQSATPFTGIEAIGATQGLQLLDAAGKRATAGTAAWRGIWEKVLPGYKDGWIANESRPPIQGSVLMTDLYKTDPFLTGRTAMTVRSGSYLGDILQAADKIGFRDEWGVVSQPVDPAAPDRAARFDVEEIYAINAMSPNAEAAWKLLKYIMSAEQAQREERYIPYRQMHTRQSGWPEDYRSKATVFYRLSPDPAAVVGEAEREDLPGYRGKLSAIEEAGGKLSASAAAGELPLDRALAELQRQAEAAVETGASAGVNP
jgi:ABC-type glycerol-3-phosphate transport system substrate-binding protein